MKLSRLRQAVIDLNDGEVIEYGTSFVTAANLALGHLGRVLPRESVCVIHGDAPLLAISGLVDVSRSYSVPGGAGALVLRVCGSGQLKNGNDILSAWAGISVSTVLRHLISSSAPLTLTFAGISGTVRDLAVFRDAPSREAVPEYGDFIIWDMAALRPDFSAFSGSAWDRATGAPVSGITDGTRLYLPPWCVGDICVAYRRRPSLVTLDGVANDDDIDIDPEAEDLIPLIMSYYIWLEDEPDKADRFLNMFLSLSSAARGARRAGADEFTSSVNGW